MLSQIGVGGMGEVYRAMDTNLKRLAASRSSPMLSSLRVLWFENDWDGFHNIEIPLGTNLKHFYRRIWRIRAERMLTLPGEKGDPK